MLEHSTPSRKHGADRKNLLCNDSTAIISTTDNYNDDIGLVLTTITHCLGWHFRLTWSPWSHHGHASLRWCQMWHSLVREPCCLRCYHLLQTTSLCVVCSSIAINLCISFLDRSLATSLHDAQQTEDSSGTYHRSHIDYDDHRRRTLE